MKLKIFCYFLHIGATTQSDAWKYERSLLLKNLFVPFDRLFFIKKEMVTASCISLKVVFSAQMCYFSY